MLIAFVRKVIYKKYIKKKAQNKDILTANEMEMMVQMRRDRWDQFRHAMRRNSPLGATERKDIKTRGNGYNRPAEWKNGHKLISAHA